MSRTFDLLVIGTGAAGDAVASAGWKSRSSTRKIARRDRSVCKEFRTELVAFMTILCRLVGAIGRDIARQPRPQTARRTSLEVMRAGPPSLAANVRY